MTTLAIVGSIALTLSTSAIGFAASSSVTVDLTFPPRAGSEVSSVVLTLPGIKARHRLSLEPDFDVGKHVVGLDLVLRPLNASRHTRNLLEPTTRWHGYQKFIFAASDFANGADRSILGAVRDIPVTRLGLVVRIRVLDVKVVAVAEMVPGEPNFEFAGLKLRIVALRSEAELN
jgi:hypothetical protein